MNIRICLVFYLTPLLFLTQPGSAESNYVQFKDNCKVYSGPSVKQLFVEEVKKGSLKISDSEKEGWLKIKLEFGHGFVPKSCVSNLLIEEIQPESKMVVIKAAELYQTPLRDKKIGVKLLPGMTVVLKKGVKGGDLNCVRIGDIQGWLKNSEIIGKEVYLHMIKRPLSSKSQRVKVVKFNVLVYAGPDEKYIDIAVVSEGNILYFLEKEPAAVWSKVQLETGYIGWVKSENIVDLEPEKTRVKVEKAPPPKEKPKTPLEKGVDRLDIGISGSALVLLREKFASNTEVNAPLKKYTITSSGGGFYVFASYYFLKFLGLDADYHLNVLVPFQDPEIADPLHASVQRFTLNAKYRHVFNRPYSHIAVKLGYLFYGFFIQATTRENNPNAPARYVTSQYHGMNVGLDLKVQLYKGLIANLQAYFVGPAKIIETPNDSGKPEYSLGTHQMFNLIYRVHRYCEVNLALQLNYFYSKFTGFASRDESNTITSAVSNNLSLSILAGASFVY